MSTLILLVGSNPLPNYLAAVALKPERVALVYSNETKDAKNRLRTLLGEVNGWRPVFVDQDLFICDAKNASKVQRVIRKVVQNGKDVLLNYTGGTKVMAAHALMAFLDCGGNAAAASYLDEGGADRKPRLRFDHGESESLDTYGFSLTLKTVLGLHGIAYKPREDRTPAPTAADAHALLWRVLEDESVKSALYRESKRLEQLRNPTSATAQPFNPAAYGLQLSIGTFPTDPQLASFVNADGRRSWFRQWWKFLGGEWLDSWVGNIISDLSLPDTVVTVGVNASRHNGRELQIDVAVVRGHRVYLISCTTDPDIKMCKSKLFEIAVRSRQLGGDLARGALVCLADADTVASLHSDLEDAWGAGNTTRVFGIDDVRTWAGYGADANLGSLKNWLES